jgi:amidase
MSKGHMTLHKDPLPLNSGHEPIHWMDAHDQADLVRRGEVEASELVEISIRRIQQHNPAIGAVIHERFDRAREEAALVDRAAPLAGVPTLVKETTPLAGEPHDLGSPAIAASGRRASVDDPIVTTMRRAGMIVLGQSMAPEFALASTSENRVHGAARNPWNTGHTSGGSSGGASAAVAAGFVPIGQGGDGGGSIRMPASFCDLVGLKPSRGLIAPKPGGDRWGHSVPAFTTRSVRDTALMMDLLRTDHPGPLGRGTPRDLFRSSIARDPRQLRIGILTNATTTGEPVAPEVDAAVMVAATTLEGLGHDVVEEHPVRFTNPANITAFFDALSVTATASIDSLAASTGSRLTDDDLDPVTALWDRRGRTITGMELAAAFTEIERLRAEMGAWWNGGFDVLVAPVFATPPLELGWPWREPDGIQGTVDVVRFTAPINSTGQPAIAVPVGFSAKGLPIGVQFIGGLGCDSLLVSLAAQYERARPWHGRHAPGL